METAFSEINAASISKSRNKNENEWNEEFQKFIFTLCDKHVKEEENKKEAKVVEINDFPTAEEQNIKDDNSAENFQKFLYELFEKNGVLNDMRASLRGHIVNLLKSAQTGTQKRYTERLELSLQAINMLLAEYLICLEFNYSLSVFVSELPLSNMIFGFAKSLLQLSPEEDFTKLRFSDGDVWSILNYLGLQLDSEHACNIAAMYKRDHLPLLLCILRDMPFYKRNVQIDDNSEKSSTSSAKSCESLQNKKVNKNRNDKCHHYMCCKTCQRKIRTIKEKYKQKKSNVTKNDKEVAMNQMGIEELVKNMNFVEKSLIDEMFQQLKSVYEAEIEMMKAEEQRRIKHSLATHMLQFQRRKDEMEEAYRERENELERNVGHKKRFLWRLAHSLRTQHDNMARAMAAVNEQAADIASKEEMLNKQLIEAEVTIKNRSEDMKKQISSELSVLVTHLEAMRKERDSLNREKTKLEYLQKFAEFNPKSLKMSNKGNEQDLYTRYEILRNEIDLLKRYLETSKFDSKRFVESSTVTDNDESVQKVLNNEQENVGCGFDDRNSCVKMAPHQLVNDLKKQKNVNFKQSKSPEQLLSRNASPAQQENVSIEPTLTLSEENQRLRTFANQQQEHIRELTTHQTRLQAELSAVRTAADTLTQRARISSQRIDPIHINLQRASTSSPLHGSGGGEQVAPFSSLRPRLTLPGDSPAFIDFTGPRSSEGKRHLINQWRALRKMAPLGGVSKTRSPSPCNKEHCLRDRPASAGAKLGVPASEPSVIEPHAKTSNKVQEEPDAPAKLSSSNRDKSPKTFLREAKAKLRTKDLVKTHQPKSKREKSPNSVIREAKLRLRKLEIEAEAVEKSYLDFRKRQSERTSDSANISHIDAQGSWKDYKTLVPKRSCSPKEPPVKPVTVSQGSEQTKPEVEKLLRDCNDKYDAYFKNRYTLSSNVKPIPLDITEFDKHNQLIKHGNYIETPITEFRKLYLSEKSSYSSKPVKYTNMSTTSRTIDKIEVKKNDVRTLEDKDINVVKKLDEAEFEKKAEYEILKENINKIYNLKEPSPIIDRNVEEKPSNDKIDIPEANTTNLLRIEVENTKSSKETINDSENNLLVYVESSLDRQKVSEAEIEGEQISTKMTIIITPKESPTSPVGLLKLPRSQSPEAQANITRNDVLEAIFNAHDDVNDEQNNESVSKLDLHEEANTDAENMPSDEYADDFSADVDNYNSHHKELHCESSPISIPKTSDDDTFWDS